MYNNNYNFSFFLAPEFPVNSYILAQETLRIFNQYRLEEVFNYENVSENGEKVRSSNGMWWEQNNNIEEIIAPDFLLIFASNLPTQKISNQTLATLRYLHKNGTKLIAVDTGAFYLAEAGLITRDTKVCIHWEAKNSFRERYPYTNLSDDIYVINKNDLYFCAGGVSIVDLMIKIISDLKGISSSKEVSTALIHKTRNNSMSQIDNLSHESSNYLCNKVIKIMEENIENPISLQKIAKELNTSLRTIERYFKDHHGVSPIKYYSKIRIQKARNLLFYDEYKISDVANMTGFSYNTVFINTFRKFYNRSPSEYRRFFRKRQFEN